MCDKGKNKKRVMGAKGHTFLSGHDKWGEKVGPAEFYTYLVRCGQNDFR